MAALLADLRNASARGALPGLVWALSSTEAGVPIELPPGTPIPEVAGGWVWLHFNLADHSGISFLGGLRELPRESITLLKAHDEIPQIHFSDMGHFGVICDLKRELGAAGEDLGSLHFIMTGKVLITARRSSLNAAGLTRQRILAGLRVPTVEDLFSIIIEQVVDGLDVYTEKISREVDSLEDRIISGSIGDTRGRLARHRRSTVRLRRHISELRLLFQRIERSGRRADVPERIMHLATELLQESELLDRDAASLSDRTRQLQDEVIALLAEETNKHLRVLSVLSIVFLPPTFIAGLFGMNLHGMLFAGHELGFWGAVGLAMLSSVAVLFVLRRIGILTW
ncbi:MAG: hypothetical protein MUC37_09030 [Hyphomicrobium sp.]|jgi:zinc transporter|nr:hypothetical protein [Hyphomicrobium sp.]